MKFGDLTAQKLMECLLSRPKAGKALTKALQKVKVVHTEHDALEVCLKLLVMFIEQGVAPQSLRGAEQLQLHEVLHAHVLNAGDARDARAGHLV
jgi:hypothetical protein